MKRRDLLRQLERLAADRGVGFALDREGGRHSVYRFGTVMVPIPRHSEIAEQLARAIIRQCTREGRQ